MKDLMKLILEISKDAIEMDENFVGYPNIEGTYNLTTEEVDSLLNRINELLGETQ